MRIAIAATCASGDIPIHDICVEVPLADAGGVGVRPDHIQVVVGAPVVRPTGPVREMQVYVAKTDTTTTTITTRMLYVFDLYDVVQPVGAQDVQLVTRLHRPQLLGLEVTSIMHSHYS